MKLFDAAIRFVSLKLRYWFSKRNTNKGKFFMIISERSVGSRMLKRWFINHGCEGNLENHQIFAYVNPDPYINLAVMKSDYNGRFYERIFRPFNDFIKLFKRIGYDVQIIHLRRNQEGMIASQLRRGHEINTKIANEYSIKAKEYINTMKEKFFEIWEEVSYDKFISEEEYRKELSNKFGLTERVKEKYNLIKI